MEYFTNLEELLLNNRICYTEAAMKALNAYVCENNTPFASILIRRYRLLHNRVSTQK